nr:unnamed protein product [Callosobruchus analis]
MTCLPLDNSLLCNLFLLFAFWCCYFSYFHLLRKLFYRISWYAILKLLRSFNFLNSDSSLWYFTFFLDSYNFSLLLLITFLLLDNSLLCYFFLLFAFWCGYFSYLDLFRKLFYRISWHAILKLRSFNFLNSDSSLWYFTFFLDSYNFSLLLLITFLLLDNSLLCNLFLLFAFRSCYFSYLYHFRKFFYRIS